VIERRRSTACRALGFWRIGSRARGYCFRTAARPPTREGVAGPLTPTAEIAFESYFGVYLVGNIVAFTA
jgi:hypothetical protein